jgi:protein-ribulosamine 3-kinase
MFVNKIVEYLQQQGVIRLNDRMTDAQQVLGGDINECTVITLQSGQKFFIKTNVAKRAFMFSAESVALEELAATGCVRVPAVLGSGVVGNTAFLALEYVPLTHKTSQAAEKFGEQLAQLHRIAQPYFGWGCDNTIGRTMQHNSANNSWVGFWQESRLLPQIEWAQARGLTGKEVDDLLRLTEQCGALVGHNPTPALLHGDLWGGNWSVTAAGTPIMYDPASYYGDREADVAMTELFGGFPDSFYQGYNRGWCLSPEYQTRKTLYNLYHVINHYNLFGGGYGQQAVSMARQLLSVMG